MNGSVKRSSRYLLGAATVAAEAGHVEAGAIDRANALKLARSSEVLKQIAFVQEALPGKLIEHIRELSMLVNRTADGMRRVDCMVRQPQADAARDFFIVEAPALSDFLMLTAILSDCLGALSTHQPRSAEVDALTQQTIQASRQSEQRFLDIFSDALSQFVVDGNAAAAHPVEAPSTSALQAYLRTQRPDLAAARVVKVTRAAGVNSKAIFEIELEAAPFRSAIMRQDSSFGQHSVSGEFALLKTLRQAQLPVAPAVAGEDRGGALGAPFVIMERVAGRPFAPSELSENGRAVAIAMADALARIHQLDLSLPGMPTRFEGTARSRVRRTIEAYYGVWQKDRVSPSLLMEAGYAWLRTHVDVVDERLALVHGDFDLRNILVEDQQLTAVLDWELAHIGHPAEDLGYCRPDVIQLIPWDEFIGAYRRSGGPEVSPAAIDFFEIWRVIFRNTTVMTASANFVRGLHDDFLLGSTAFIENFREMRDLARRLDDSGVRQGTPFSAGSP